MAERSRDPERMRQDEPMGAEVDATQFSREDRKRHREKVRRGAGRVRSDADRGALRLRATDDRPGDRSSTWSTTTMQPAMRNAEVLAAIADPMFQTELGRFNIEINVAPRRLADGGFRVVRGVGSPAWRRTPPTTRPEAIGTHLAMVGILPTLMPEHVTLGQRQREPALLPARPADLRRPRGGPGDPTI